MLFRSLSEFGLIVQNVPDDEVHAWTDESNVIKIDKRPFQRIPNASPPVWFGWTHFGARYEIQDAGQAIKHETPSMQWVEAYAANRKFGIEMLFNPDAIDLDELISEHVANRSDRLKRAGRIGAGHNTGAKASESIAAMIQASAAKFNLFG